MNYPLAANFYLEAQRATEKPIAFSELSGILPVADPVLFPLPLNAVRPLVFIVGWNPSFHFANVSSLLIGRES